MRISDDPLHPAATNAASTNPASTNPASTNRATPYTATPNPATPNAATPNAATPDLATDAAVPVRVPTPAPTPTPTVPAPTTAPRDSSVHTVAKTLAILEVVAERGSATAKEVSETLGFPLPTAYRLLHALVHADYLVHVRDERRFELGRKLRALGAMASTSGATPHPATG